MVANCTITPNEQCLAYSAVVMSKELFSEFVSTYGNDPVAMLEEFTNFGMTTVGYTADPFKAELNGSCSYDYYLATLIFDLTGESYRILRPYHLYHEPHYRRVLSVDFH